MAHSAYQATHMVFVPSCDFSLEHKVVNVATAVVGVVPVAVLFEQSQQTPGVEERTQPVRRHPLTAL